jgi:hypothetical protein
MNYSKPEVAVLGAAAKVIQMQIKPKTSGIELGLYRLAPTYDLDE